MNSKELVSPQDKMTTVRELLERMKPQLALALPKHLTPDRMVRVTLTNILRNPRLVECTPQSLAGALLQAAQLGLEPDNVTGQAYLVPFKNNKKGGILEVQLIPGYQGLMELARRSQTVLTIEPHVVYAKDTFRFKYGLKQDLTHIPHPGEEAGEAVAYYAIARLVNGTAQFHVMWKAEIEEVRQKYSRAKDEGPWVTNFDEMGLKTVIRRVCKYIPKSIELQIAVALDEKAEAGIPQELETLVAWEPPERSSSDKPAPSKLDQLTNSMTHSPETATSEPRAFAPGEQPTLKLEKGGKAQ